jgi:hypothetical protein
MKNTIREESHPYAQRETNALNSCLLEALLSVQYPDFWILLVPPTPPITPRAPIRTPTAPLPLSSGVFQTSPRSVTQFTKLEDHFVVFTSASCPACPAVPRSVT